MDTQGLDKYIDALDALGREFSVQFAEFDKIKDDLTKLQLGGEADTAFAAAIEAATNFALVLRQLSEEKLPFLGGSKVKAAREKVLSHAMANLQHMNGAIDSAPKSLREFAQTKMVLVELERR